MTRKHELYLINLGLEAVLDKLVSKPKIKKIKKAKGKKKWTRQQRMKFARTMKEKWTKKRAKE